jgi:hypothetical protein
MKTLSEDTLQALANHLGIDELSFGPEGAVCIQVEGLGTYWLEEDAHDWLLSFAKPFPRRDKKLYQKALSLSLPDQHPFNLSVGLIHETDLWLGTRLPKSNLNLQDLLQRMDDIANITQTLN